ncbi:10710_t:CDS:2, partial [Dentiscutata heterogama]
MEKSSRFSVNRLSVGGSLVNRLLVRTSTSWFLLVVSGSSVSRSLGIRSLVRSLGGGSSVNRTSVGNNISGYDLTFKRKTFNMNDTNNNKRQGYTQLVLANKFKIGESTISKILKKQDYFLSIDPNSTQAKSKRNHST